jgi:hypothetical protein
MSTCRCREAALWSLTCALASMAESAMRNCGHSPPAGAVHKVPAGRPNARSAVGSRSASSAEQLAPASSASWSTPGWTSGRGGLPAQATKLAPPPLTTRWGTRRPSRDAAGLRQRSPPVALGRTCTLAAAFNHGHQSDALQPVPTAPPGPAEPMAGDQYPSAEAMTQEASDGSSRSTHGPAILPEGSETPSKTPRANSISFSQAVVGLACECAQPDSDQAPSRRALQGTAPGPSADPIHHNVPEKGRAVWLMTRHGNQVRILHPARAAPNGLHLS